MQVTVCTEPESIAIVFPVFVLQNPSFPATPSAFFFFFLYFGVNGKAELVEISEYKCKIFSKFLSFTFVLLNQNNRVD